MRVPRAQQRKAAGCGQRGSNVIDETWHVGGGRWWIASHWGALQAKKKGGGGDEEEEGEEGDDAEKGEERRTRRTRGEGGAEEKEGRRGKEKKEEKGKSLITPEHGVQAPNIVVVIRNQLLHHPYVDVFLGLTLAPFGRRGLTTGGGQRRRRRRPPRYAHSMDDLGVAPWNASRGIHYKIYWALRASLPPACLRG